jgi:UbiD family decarboxylase
MSLRDYIRHLDEKGDLVHIKQPVSKHLQASGILKQLDPKPIYFEDIKESQFRVAGNLFPSKASFADYFGIQPAEIIPFLTRAIENPTRPQVIDQAPCQEVILMEPNLDTLPILGHLVTDGGPYITSGVFVARHPEYGQNLDFHRCMQFSPTEMAVRVVKGRHFDRFLEELGQVDVAVCVGLPPNVLAAGATSVELGLDELWIANAMEPLQVVHAKTVDLLVPAEAEFVLEGTVYRLSLIHI